MKISVDDGCRNDRYYFEFYDCSIKTDGTSDWLIEIWRDFPRVSSVHSFSSSCDQINEKVNQLILIMLLIRAPAFALPSPARVTQSRNNGASSGKIFTVPSAPLPFSGLQPISQLSRGGPVEPCDMTLRPRQRRRSRATWFGLPTSPISTRRQSLSRCPPVTDAEWTWV